MRPDDGDIRIARLSETRLEPYHKSTDPNRGPMAPSETELSRIPFWKHLTPAERAELAAASRIVDVEAGVSVQGSGHGCAGVVFVRAGSLRASMHAESGRQITLFHVEASECCVLAASCVLPMVTFDIVLQSTERSSLLVVEPRTYARIAEANAHAEAFTFRQATERFSDCMWVMQQVLFMSFDTRLAIFLLDESARTGSETLKLTHEQIAQHMGSAREVVTRMLRYFADEGYVRLSRGTVELADKAALRALTVQA